MEDHDSAGGGADPASARAALLDEAVAVGAKLRAAGKALGEACKRGSLRMSIPVQPGDDDETINRALVEAYGLIERLAPETKALREEVERLRNGWDAALRQADADVRRYVDENERLTAELARLRAEAGRAREEGVERAAFYVWWRAGIATEEQRPLLEDVSRALRATRLSPAPPAERPRQEETEDHDCGEFERGWFRRDARARKDETEMQRANMIRVAEAHADGKAAGERSAIERAVEAIDAQRSELAGYLSNEGDVAIRKRLDCASAWLDEVAEAVARLSGERQPNGPTEQRERSPESGASREKAPQEGDDRRNAGSTPAAPASSPATEASALEECAAPHPTASGWACAYSRGHASPHYFQPARPAPAAQGDVFCDFAEEYGADRGSLLAELARRRFGPLVAAMERIHGAYKDPDPGAATTWKWTYHWLEEVSGAALAAMRQERTT